MAGTWPAESAASAAAMRPKEAFHQPHHAKQCYRARHHDNATMERPRSVKKTRQGRQGRSRTTALATFLRALSPGATYQLPNERDPSPLYSVRLLPVLGRACDRMAPSKKSEELTSLREKGLECGVERGLGVWGRGSRIVVRTQKRLGPRWRKTTVSFRCVSRGDVGAVTEFFGGDLEDVLRIALTRGGDRV
ncbi:hypothetical protein LZ32DRAFT_224304 [Colletotrichum eremochloae]|nr:hypothetical protein LZ32DRAFT_224304 [Colletotrichum eremochloae]